MSLKQPRTPGPIPFTAPSDWTGKEGHIVATDGEIQSLPSEPPFAVIVEGAPLGEKASILPLSSGGTFLVKFNSLGAVAKYGKVAGSWEAAGTIAPPSTPGDIIFAMALQPATAAGELIECVAISQVANP